MKLVCAMLLGFVLDLILEILMDWFIRYKSSGGLSIN